MPIDRGKSAADIEPDKGDARAVSHPVGGFERQLIGFGFLYLATDVEAQTNLEAYLMEPLHQFHRMAGCGAEFLRQLVHRMTLGLQPHENADRARIEIKRPHDPEHLGNLVLMVERHHPYTVSLKRQTDIRLCLDRVHVQHFRVRRCGAHSLELARRGDVKDFHTGLDQCLEHHRFTIGLDRIGGVSGKQFHEL